MLSFKEIKELIDLVTRARPLGSGDRAGRVPAPHRGRPSRPATERRSAERPRRRRRPLPAATSGGRRGAGRRGGAEGVHVITSPIVGTFYRAPSPEAEPSPRSGQRCRKGKILCIIESMKLMNEIESDVEGEIVEVYPRNGQPVEYGEKLFAIRLRRAVNVARASLDVPRRCSRRS